MPTRDEINLMVLRILQPGRMKYDDARAQYERQVGIGGAAEAAFAQLVLGLISEGFVERAHEAGCRIPVITDLWLTEKGKAWVSEGGR